MIIYFSATGNCKYTSERIAAENERQLSIPELMKENPEETIEIDISDEDKLGIISPVYDWGLPSIVNEFLGRVHFNFNEKPYTYLVITYGTTTGKCGYYVNEHMKKQGLELDGRFSVKFPDTWTVTFDLSNKDYVAEINRNAEGQLDKVRKQILNNVQGDFMDMKLPKLLSDIAQSRYNREIRKTSHLHVEDSCIGCGLCEKKCPVGAIQIKDKKPVWVKEKCTMCLGCLHRCPKFAIQYENKTRNHGQYVNPHVWGC